MPDRDDIPAYSRSGTTNALGPLGEASKVRLPLVTQDVARSLAAAEGLCLGEWIRDLVMVRCHGVDMLSTVHAERLRSVAGIGNEKGS